MGDVAYLPNAKKFTVEWFDYNKHVPKLGSAYGPATNAEIGLVGNGQGPATALVDPEGRTVCVIGCNPYWTGVGEAWMLTSMLVTKYPKTATRFVRNSIQAVFQMLNLHRLSITVHVDFIASHKWVQSMGFEPEGVKRCYFENGADAVEYAICPKRQQ